MSRISAPAATLAIALLLAPALRAQDEGFGPPPPPVVAGPKLVLPETSFDWGSVLQGEVVEHAFTVRNEGTSLLQITQVQPG